MNCQCQGIEELFNEREVASELETYRRKGPDGTTRMLVEALRAQGVQGRTLLDIGGGVGAIQHALLAAGASTAVDVDASRAYLEAARQEARRRGLAERIRFQHGNFVDLAPDLPPADVVTLDRVLCCYDDVQRLVSLSAERAGRLYGLVYPRDEWWNHIATAVMNFYFRLRKNPFRTFIHSSRMVEELLARRGLKRVYYRHTAVWQVAVYAAD